MTTIVFLRGANAIGARVFSPVALAERLSHLEVENIGAAGTFIVRARVGQKTVSQAFAAACPHDAEVIVRPLDEIGALLEAALPTRKRAGRVFVSVLASKPKVVPNLPLERADPWMARIESVAGAFVIGRKRPGRGKWLDANGVVEREFGVRATTRVWETMKRITKAASDRPDAEPAFGERDQAPGLSGSRLSVYRSAYRLAAARSLRSSSAVRRGP